MRAPPMCELSHNPLIRIFIVVQTLILWQLMKRVMSSSSPLNIAQLGCEGNFARRRPWILTDERVAELI